MAAHRLPQTLDAQPEPEPVGFDLPDQGRELSCGEARDAFEFLFRDLFLRVNNQRIIDAHKKG